MWERHWPVIENEQVRSHFLSPLITFLLHNQKADTVVPGRRITPPLLGWSQTQSLIPLPSFFPVSQQECEEWPIRGPDLSHPFLICPFLGIPKSSFSFSSFFFALFCELLYTPLFLSHILSFFWALSPLSHSFQSAQHFKFPQITVYRRAPPSQCSSGCIFCQTTARL